MEEDTLRLQKYLASCGVASRRKCEEYIEQGLVKVNGIVITELGTKINPNKDIVTFKEQKIENLKEEPVYILLNKPIRLCYDSKRPIQKRYSFRLSKNKKKNSTSTED